MNGFKIRRLLITGNNLDTKSVSFKNGLNLITGPSDTGKSFIFQCIDFIFGKSKPPKKIKESKNYEHIYLEIEDHENKTISTIQRSLIDSKYLYYKDVEFEKINTTVPLSLDGNFNTNTDISSLLLKLSDFQIPIQIKKNQSFTKVNFTIRSLASYILIKEGSMIAERSPMYFGSYTDRTRDLHTFKFLLTGIDDSASVKTDKKEIWSAKKNANLDLLNELLEKKANELTYLEEEAEKISSNKFKDNLELSLEETQKKISTFNNELSKYEFKKNRLLSDIRYNENLKFKFKLLKEQYLSDIERLNFIDEGSFLMNQLKITKCPHCGKDISNVQQHIHSDIDINQVNQACDFEISKIKSNLSELEKSNQTATEVIDSLQHKLEEILEMISKSNNHLNTVLQPKLANINSEWNKKLTYEILLSDIENIKIQVSEYKSLISNTAATKHKLSSNSNQEIIDNINNSSFPKLFEELLIKCLFTNEQSLPISFFINSDSELDFLIKDNTRDSYGKGYRSIIVSLFYITLLNYCAQENLPHPNLLILDSPVNAFTDIEANEKLPESVQHRFFEYLANNFKDKQIIVIENETVLSELQRKVNIIEFTKEINNKRYGFF